MPEIKITDSFPSLLGSTATLFRYDRWKKILFLKINLETEQKKAFLAFYGCEVFEFKNEINVDDIRLIEDLETLIIQEPSRNFTINCVSVELWNKDKFDAYDLELSIKLDEDKRYGVRRPIFSIEDLL
jgi:hypothetical protein